MIFSILQPYVYLMSFDSVAEKLFVAFYLVL